jgi:hypothetical protein
MKTKCLLIIVLLGLCATGRTFADEEACNCKIYPYKPDPPCFKQCTALLLSTSSKSDLERILGLDPALAKKVSAQDAELTAAEKQELNEKLKDLNQAKVNALTKEF